MPHSHHSHSGQFCRHAEQGTSLEDAVQEAIQQGFRTFGLSEHCPRYRQQDLYPEESDLDPARLESIYLAFLDEAHRLKRQYADRIELLVGLETDYITELDLAGLQGLLEEHGDRIEYIVGGMHHVGETPIDFDPPTYRNAVELAGQRAGVSPSNSSKSSSSSTASLTAFFIEYFDAQHTLITRVQPDVLAHIDLCRLYTPAVRLDDAAAYPGVWDRVRRNVRAVVEYGGLFEASSASLRKGWETGYPGKAVLQLILEMGGKLCLSDDSHGPAFVGLNYGKLRRYLVEQGVEDLYYLSAPPARTDEEIAESREAGEQGQPGGLRGRPRLAVRKHEGKWQSDAFWTTCQR